MTYAEAAVDQTISRLLSEHPCLDASSDGALDNLDQFHIGGADAVDLLIPTLALADTDVVLDIGSGFGGPARQIARRTGNRVIGIDITAAYVDAARDLTDKAKLSNLVEFEAADIATFQPETHFQAAITMHVQMNVQDKVSWFTHIGRHLTPGARLAIWDVCQPARHELAWPMPWSLDGSDSFVVDAESLRTAVEQAGFSTLEWTQQSTWVQAWVAKTMGAGLPTGPALPMLLDDGYTRVINYATALTNGALEVWRGCFTKNSTN
ncbi:MAG: sarcosine/dimethylglycine N-methyltransferase [Pseudonocardiales bacterium]|jgi:SAM-dependent methyltransferase|nr:sarcosine/dimethylglycine N-methyltransferase [Pseudonocardiales bacterium]